MENKIYSNQELKQMFPESHKKLKAHVKDIILLSGHPDEAAEELTNFGMDHSVNSANRLLYDFFDREKIYLFLTTKSQIDIDKNERVLEENKMFLEAFEKLETKLQNICQEDDIIKEN